MHVFRAGEIHDQLFESKPGLPKRFQRLSKHRAIGRSILPTGHVPEDLLYKTLLTLSSSCEHLPQLPGGCEAGILQTGYEALGIDFKLDFLGLCAPSLHATLVGKEQELVFFAPHPDGVELFEPESHGIDQIVAADTHLVRSMCR